MQIEPCAKCGDLHLEHWPCRTIPPSEEVVTLRARVAELERELRLIREHYNLTIKIG